MKHGVAIVGVAGMTAATTVAGVRLIAEGLLQESYAVTSSDSFPQIPLPNASDFVFAGWDLPGKSVAKTVAASGYFQGLGRVASDVVEDVSMYPAILSEYDFAAAEASSVSQHPTLRGMIAKILEHLHDFRSRAELDTMTVAYLGSPHKSFDPSQIDLRGTGSLPAPSSIAHMLAAVQAGASFVDFTPCAALQVPGIHEYATAQRVKIAGRDLSTGQTMLKAAIYELFRRRSIVPRAWYSTNLIGNHDGFVLSHDDYNELKMADKRAAVSVQNEQEVRIEYMPTWGDRKESWDAVIASSWLDQVDVELRLNWRGADSILAAPMIIDVLRLLQADAANESYGLQEQLGFFFKRPFGAEDQPLSARWEKLVDFYMTRCDPGAAG